MTRPPEYLDIGRRVGANVRAELARFDKTPADLATHLGITGQTARRRLSGEVPFDVVELALIAGWLGLDISALQVAA